MANTTSLVASADLTAQDVEIPGNKATVRTLRVLSLFASGGTSRGVSEVGRRLSMTKSMAYRALMTLVEQGYLAKSDEGGTYELSFGVLNLSGPDAAEPELREMAANAMTEMHRLTGKTVSLAILVDRQTLILDGVRGLGSIARQVPIGRCTPLHANAAGRAVLAYLSDAEVSRYLASPLERYTDTTLCSATEVINEVRLVRSRGYALGYGDHVQNAGGVAFPIVDSFARAQGAITVSWPADQVTPERLGEWLPALAEISATLNRRARLYPARTVHDG
jgi:DNA-binding IclR family transcriptional regulator